ncbi:MAG: nucleoside hydrolase [Candidatus Nitrosocaldus sp.]|nr:nucleoside hydrolase [Candidatus Nitrosocaldus sp.]MDW8000375.1 nucleoside hydrolase [Candidatus Nitrosocaldus sp.]
MVKVMLDMDPGVDDAVALILALNSQVEIVALSTVSGNVSAMMGAVNALRICDALGRSIRVIKGLSRKGYRRSRHAVEVHGRDGLGDAGIGMEGGKVWSRSRVPASSDPIREIADILGSYRRREVTLLCTAPLTNIAALLESHEDASRCIDRIFVMGGAYDLDAAQGNVTRYAEFNFYTDAGAADRVMASDARVVACGLELTSRRDCSVDASMLERIRAIGSRHALLAASILKNPVLRYSHFNLHDVFALAALLRPEIFAMRHARVRIETSRVRRGMCITEYRDDGNVSICHDVDAERFIGFLLDGLR